MAAGARLTSSCLPSYSSALAVPRIGAKREEQWAQSSEQVAIFESDIALKEKSPRELIHAWLFASGSLLSLLRTAHGHLSLQSHRFRIIGVDPDSTGGVLARFAEIAFL